MTYSYRGHRYPKKVTASVLKKRYVKQNCSISLWFQVDFCFHHELRRVDWAISLLINSWVEFGPPFYRSFSYDVMAAILKTIRKLGRGNFRKDFWNC